MGRYVCVYISLKMGPIYLDLLRHENGADMFDLLRLENGADIFRFIEP